jgi:hypothetical protein
MKPVYFAFAIVFILASLQLTLGYSSDRKIAVFLIDPEMGNLADLMMAPRLVDAKRNYSNAGHEIVTVAGNSKNVLKAIMNPSVKVVTYVGHGRAPTRGQKVCTTPTLAGLDAKQWREKVYGEVMREAFKHGYSEKKAIELAKRWSRNFGFEEVTNYSCGSLVNTSIGELFVKQGGVYWGASELFTPNPAHIIGILYGEGQFFLERYDVPRVAKRKFPDYIPPKFVPEKEQTVSWVIWYAEKIGFQPIFVTTKSKYKAKEPSCGYPGGGRDCNVMLDKTFLMGPYASRKQAIKAICSSLTNFGKLKGIYAGMPVAKYKGKRHNIEFIGCGQEYWR